MDCCSAWRSPLPATRSSRTWCWAIPSLLVGIWLTISIIRDLLRGEAGVDLIAVLAILGALLLGEALAAAVIGVMLATGEWLERYAAGRANRELSALVSRAPRVVHRYRDGGIEDREIADVTVGDRLLVKPGEVVPVDGRVIGDSAVLDESALTGEARLATREAGDRVSSGTVNAGAPFDLMATATAEHSTYAGIVRLVREAQTSKAPFVRMADRYAILFVPLTLIVAALAWLLSGDPSAPSPSSSWLRRARSCWRHPSPSSRASAAPPSGASSSRAAGPWRRSLGRA